MEDKTTTSFPTMGTEAAQATSVSGIPSPNTTLVPKTGNAKGGAAEGGTAAVRPHVLERNGFKGAPQINHSYPNSPESGQTYRNVRLVRSSLGNRDFYVARQIAATS